MNTQDYPHSRPPELAGMPSVYAARLMNPQEVAGALEMRPDIRARLDGHWMFCGDTSQATFQALRETSSRHPSSIRVSGFRSSNGGAYGVVTHQARGHHHRLLLPLYEPPVLRCLEALKREPFGFLIGRDLQDEALVLDGRIPGKGFSPLLPFGKELAGEQLRCVLGELPLVVAILRDPSTVPSALPGEVVHEVSVSVLIPNESMQSVLVERELEEYGL